MVGIPMKLFLSDDVVPDASGEYWIDQSRRMRIEEYHGVTVLGDFRRIMTSMISDPCWSADFHGLVDLSRAKLELTSNDVLRLALLLRRDDCRTHGWLAYVAPDSMTYGIVRMLGYWTRSTDRTRIFGSRSEAEAWLEWNCDQIPPRFVEKKTRWAPPAARVVG